MSLTQASRALASDPVWRSLGALMSVPGVSHAPGCSAALSLLRQRNRKPYQGNHYGKPWEERQLAAQAWSSEVRFQGAFGRGHVGQLRAVSDVRGTGRPWWRTTRTVRQGYWIAGLFLTVGVANLATFPGGGSISKWVQLGVGIWGILVATLYLTTAVALRRYQRGTSVPATGQDGNPRL